MEESELMKTAPSSAYGEEEGLKQLQVMLNHSSQQHFSARSVTTKPKALAMSKCLHFFPIKTSSLSLTKSIPSCMVVHTVTFYHPPNSGSKETAQLSSSRLQRTQHDWDTDCLPLETTCSLKAWRKTPCTCTNDRKVHICTKESLTPDIFTR